MAVFCHQCGSGLPLSARFCSSCGTSVPANPTAQHIPGRPLIRPRIGRQVAGVCLGLAQANGWDVAVVRVITVLAFCFSGGVAGIAYLAGWIGIPDEPLGQPGSYPPGSGAYPPGI
jgi:phage shock protein C